jgi:hypothetical protein
LKIKKKSGPKNYFFKIQKCFGNILSALPWDSVGYDFKENRKKHGEDDAFWTVTIGIIVGLGILKPIATAITRE